MLAIGYDYGTTTSWMTVWDGERRGNASMPSALLLRRNPNEVVFGEEAVCQIDTGDFVKSPKRYIVDNQMPDFAQRYHYNVADVLKSFSEKMVENVRPHGISNAPVHVTVTIPNCYDGEQMRFMRESLGEMFAQRYGKCRLHLLPEPIAAALYYVMSVPIPGGVREEKYMVTCDIGGGTTDLSVIWFSRSAVGDGRFDVMFKVVATVSDACLGGDDIDSMLFNSKLHAVDGDLVDKNTARMRVMEAKECLSHRDSTDVKVYLNNGREFSCIFNKRDLTYQLNTTPFGECESTFNERLSNLMLQLKNRTENNVAQGRNIGNARFNWGNVLLLPIGGSMRIPHLRQIFQNAFIGAQMCDLRNESDGSYNSVVYGAMYHSAVMGGMSSLCVRNIDIIGRSRFPVSVEYMQRLYPLVQTNMPDGIYNTDRIRPLRVYDDGTFEISSIRLFSREDDSVVNDSDVPDFELPIGRTFMSNGREAQDIPIKLSLKVVNSEILWARVAIEKIDADGNDFIEEYSAETILRSNQ
jgi:molecular chaperone DnaK (HSP70)